MERWNELLIEAVKEDGIFPPMATINVEAPNAKEFFEAIEQADPEYFENASTRQTYKTQTCDYIYCFGWFYVRDEDGVYRFAQKDSIDRFLWHNANELEVERQAQFETERDIDNHLLTA
jgi:hypothetical protein